MDTVIHYPSFCASRDGGVGSVSREIIYAFAPPRRGTSGLFLRSPLKRTLQLLR